MESNPYTSPSSNLFGSTGSDMEAAVPQEVITPLQRTRFWVRLISVILWISVALMLLGGLGTGIAALVGGMNEINESGDAAMAAGFLVGMSGMYVVMSFFYIYPAVKLWSYGTQISNLVNSRDPQDLVLAMNTQRAFWKFVGILTLVSIALIVLIMIGSVVFSVYAASMAVGQ